jgi:phage/plasmid primase-like uncharacterized protein
VAHDASRRPKANVGRLAAEHAAAASGGMVMLPQFTADDPGSDWNDLILRSGRSEFRRQWEGLMQDAERKSQPPSSNQSGPTLSPDRGGDIELHRSVKSRRL